MAQPAKFVVKVDPASPILPAPRGHHRTRSQDVQSKATSADILGLNFDPLAPTAVTKPKSTPMLVEVTDDADPFLALARRESNASGPSPPVKDTVFAARSRAASVPFKPPPPPGPPPAKKVAVNTSPKGVEAKSSSPRPGEDSDDERGGVDDSDLNEVKANSAALASQRNPRLVSVKMDCLAYMKKGTSFLKYGKFGFPHFRQFQLSPDNRKLVWYSKSKKLSETQVDVDDMVAITLGQTTANFTRHAAPELTRSSFSIIYDGNRKTLDLIAKDPNEFAIWTKGLQLLIEFAQNHSVLELTELSALNAEVAIKRGRRSSLAIIDAAGIPRDEELDDPLAVHHTRPDFGNKALVKDVMGQFAQLRKREGKLADRLNQFTAAPQYEMMVALVEQVRASIDKIPAWYNSGEFSAAEDECWRAGVDLDALENIMDALPT